MPGETPDPNMIDASKGMPVPETKDTLLRGSRQTGAYQTPDGLIRSHEVTSDGMKQTRIDGQPTPEALEKAKSDYAKVDEKHAESRRAYDEAVASRDEEYLKQFMPPEESGADITPAEVAPKAQKLITEVPGFEQPQKPE